MTDINYLKGVSSKEEFSRQELWESFCQGGYPLKEVSFYKEIEQMVGNGELIRLGRNRYCLPKEDKQIYIPQYSSLASDLANCINENFPCLEFTVFELIQLNEFVNHLVGQNVIVLSVEAMAMDFVFDFLKDKYPGKVFINPDTNLYHRYFTEDMIIIKRLTTEAPKDKEVCWHMRLEKLLVDIMSDKLILSSISKAEYPNIYTQAFHNYYIDTKALIRYANRRKSIKNIKNLIAEQTNIKLE